MASSMDFKKLFEKYQEEGVPNGVSIVKYCQMNGVVYSQFEKWYKYSRGGVIRRVNTVDKDAEWFVRMIGRLYMIEAENRILHQTPEQIKNDARRRMLRQYLHPCMSGR